MPFKSAVAVLVGAGKKLGVGAATARLLANSGCNVLINCLKSEDQAKQVIEECRSYGVDAELVMGDATDKEICIEIAKFAESKWGRLDFLVNSIGATKSAPYEELDALSADDFSHLFKVNVTAPYLMAQACQQLLKESQDGAIVNVSSAAGITGKGSSIAYASAKGAVNTLTLSLAQALSPEVRVNAVCPSFIDSSWWEKSFAGKPESYSALVDSVRNNNLLRQVLTPNHVAQTIMSILRNPVMTGELIRLDAGAHVGKANPRVMESKPVDMPNRTGPGNKR